MFYSFRKVGLKIVYINFKSLNSYKMHLVTIIIGEMIKVYQYVKNEYETIFYRIFYLSFYITTLFFYLTYSVIDSPISPILLAFWILLWSITAVGLEQGHIYFFKLLYSFHLLFNLWLFTWTEILLLLYIQQIHLSFYLMYGYKNV